MILTDIRLQQYRSYKDASFDLGEGVNIVVGPNAAGKTNLLEAVMMACIGKSYRAKDPVLVQNEAVWARIDTHTNENVARTVKLQYDGSGRLVKTFEIDGKQVKRLSQDQKQPIVLFEPNDMQLIEGEPVDRREYLDNLIEQYLSGYDKLQNQYRRVLAQRNALLKQSSQAGTQMFAWNLRLTDLGEQIIKKRLQLIASINEAISTTYSSIAKQDKKVSLVYESSIDTDNYSTALLKKLETSIELDLARGFTGSGPHRDDFTIMFGDQPALLSASRGEIRTLMLSLKIIELKVLEKILEVRPILLLDDVFSELDGARRRALTRFLNNYQTIITTTDADTVIDKFIDNYTVLPIGANTSY